MRLQRVFLQNFFLLHNTTFFKIFTLVTSNPRERVFVPSVANVQFDLHL